MSLQAMETLVPRLLKPLWNKRDYLWVRLIWDWAQIVGIKRAEQFEPTGIRSLKSQRSHQQILLLDCYGISPFEAQFQTPVIVQTINQYLGAAYVTSIRYNQRSSKPRSIHHPSHLSSIPDHQPTTIEEAISSFHTSRIKRLMGNRI